MEIDLTHLQQQSIDDDMRTMPPERVNEILDDMNSEEANEFLEQLGALRAGMIYAAQPPFQPNSPAS